MHAGDTLSIVEPRAWPGLPSPWSFSVLREIEACPRRWALGAAEYSETWDAVGYPPLLSVKALAGQVIHEAVKRIAAAASEAGCRNIRDGAAVGVLQRVGGFTNVLNEVIERMIGRHRANPRLKRVRDQIGAELAREIPTMRQQVQRHLLRVTLTPRRSSHQLERSGESRAPLGDGSYSELRLLSEDLNWVGMVDLLQVEDGQCSIWEFKSGTPDEQHQEQLRFYALLWAEDKGRNPAGIPVARLILSYADRWFEIAPPGPDELAALRHELRARIAAAAKAGGEKPPPARPDPGNCRFCGVRHLCQEYWAMLPTWKRSGGNVDEFGDAEVTVGSKRGPRSWDAVMITSAWLPRQSRLVLTLSTTGDPMVSGVTSGIQARLLNVRLPPGETEVPLVCVSTHSEVFRMG